MEPTENTARQQFVEDYTLVTDNNYKAYTAVHRLMNQGGVTTPWLSERLRESFENRIGEVVERERKSGNEYTADLIAELLLGWGSAPFDDIARHYIAQAEEIKKVNA
jgi:hypothetical protein